MKANETKKVNEEVIYSPKQLVNEYTKKQLNQTKTALTDAFKTSQAVVATVLKSKSKKEYLQLLDKVLNKKQAVEFVDEYLTANKKNMQEKQAFLEKLMKYNQIVGLCFNEKTGKYNTVILKKYVLSIVINGELIKDNTSTPQAKEAVNLSILKSKGFLIKDTYKRSSAFTIFEPLKNIFEEEEAKKNKETGKIDKIIVRYCYIPKANMYKVGDLMEAICSYVYDGTPDLKVIKECIEDKNSLLSVWEGTKGIKSLPLPETKEQKIEKLKRYGKSILNGRKPSELSIDEKNLLKNVEDKIKELEKAA